MTTGNKRVAFAVGRFGVLAPVVVILRGRPSTARGKLDAAHYAEKPSGIKLSSLPKRLEHVNHGELVWDSATHVLTLECAKEQTALLSDMFWNFYQKQWGHTPFWLKKLHFEGIKADAETHPESKGGDDAKAPGAAVNEPIGQETAALAQSAEVPIVDETAGPQEPEPSRAVTDPAIQAQAQKLTQSLLQAQKNLGMTDSADSAELDAMFERVLENTAEQRRQGNPTELKPDQNGIDVVADLLLELGSRLATQRALLGNGERPNGSVLRTMVGENWNRHQKDEPAVLLERLIKVVGLSFAKDGDALRGFLGLPPADALIPFLSARWEDAHASIRDRIEEIKTTVDETLKREDPTDSVEKRGGSWDKVDQMPKDLDPAKVQGILRSLKGARGADRAEKAARLKADIDDYRKFIEDSMVIGELDRNPFGIDFRARETFLKVLEEIRKTVPEVS
jgi:hypothetical protein